MTTHDEASDLALLQALACDVDSNFPQLMNTYYATLFRFALDKLRCPQTAEDVLQECWVKIYQALQHYSPEKIRTLSLKAWLYKIVDNTCKTDLAKKNRFRITPIDLVSHEEMNQYKEVLPEEIVELKEHVDLVKTLISQLPQGYRKVLTLRLLEDMDSREIAEQLGKSITAIRTAVSRGTKLLSEQLKVHTD